MNFLTLPGARGGVESSKESRSDFRGCGSTFSLLGFIAYLTRC